MKLLIQVFQTFKVRFVEDPTSMVENLFEFVELLDFKQEKEIVQQKVLISWCSIDGFFESNVGVILVLGLRQSKSQITKGLRILRVFFESIKIIETGGLVVSIFVFEVAQIG